jgi:glycogen synthase
VIRSKASASVDELGDRYILLGPYKEMCARQEVETFELPKDTPLGIAVQKLRDIGFRVKRIQTTSTSYLSTIWILLQVVTGNWLVDGNPLIVLFDVTSASWNLDRYKHELFQKSGIGIPHLDAEANDAVVFGYMTAQFIVEVRKIETTGEINVTKSFNQSMNVMCLEIYRPQLKRYRKFII